MSAAVDFGTTQKRQWQASDPATSAWVVANAGSGKTHVLTQRVIRLLLSGADPAALLCLTFTKVAAAEMSRRIFETLGGWATLPTEELARQIQATQGRPASPDQVKAARRLFARALETPGGLKIQTIHAFCEKLLHQFPFEANVPGQFAVLDQTAAAALLAHARSAVLGWAAREPESRLGKAVRYLAEHATDLQINTALDAVIANRDPLRAWMEKTGEVGEAGGIDDAVRDLRARLGLRPDETEESICATICDAASWLGVDCQKLTAALDLAASGKNTDQQARAALSNILAAANPIDEARARIDFFTVLKEGDYAARAIVQRFGAEFRAAQGDLQSRFTVEAERLTGLATKLAAARTLAATEALLIVGDEILGEYALAKRHAGQLDFGDLIVKARNLLIRADAAAWVLYKLDARIDHILVDEAQDTSPDQWAIVRALAEDFFGGETARGERTIFAVGDDKQSIFGFQGAAPRMLAEMARFFERLVAGAGKGFVRLPLQLSFRSTSEILNGVDIVFDGEVRSRVTEFDYELHSARRLNEPGRVVVLPRRVRARAEQPDDWMQPLDAPTQADEALADDVVREIRALLGTRLPSGKVVRPGEILILCRKRDAFFTAVNRTLRAAGIPSAGADRLPVSTHISVLDLLALADVMLLPEDDLQLAACLKSPLIGLSESELMGVAAGRRASLWRAVLESGEPAIAAAAASLRKWRSAADHITPFRFFAEVLGPDGGRRAFRERLGGEADEVLDAFLSQALAFEELGPPTLQGFTEFIRASQGDIKREAEEASSGVRVMTVHGAKGLEADVVFLADTGSRIVIHQHRDCLVDIGDANGPAFLWRRNKEEATELQRRADLIADAETHKEYIRLLYVGMTRARDVLYVCGIRSEQREVEGCWYSLAAQALVPGQVGRDPATQELLAPYTWPQPERTPVPGEAAADPQSQQGGTGPDWLFRPAPPLPRAPEPLRPSRALAEPDPQPAGGRAGYSGSGGSSGLARGRGEAVHRLLQVLPEVAAADRAEAARRILASGAPEVSAISDEIWREARAVLDHAALASIFGPGSRAEVPIVGNLRTGDGEFAVSGRIDRLLRSDKGWLVVDFKTDRAIPSDPGQADPAYVLQMALYQRLLTKMAPDAEVEVMLVWTAGPKIMPIPPQFLEQALARLGILKAGVP